MNPGPDPALSAGLAWSGMTHRGHVRQNNEDAFLALTFDAQSFQYLGKYGEGTLETGDYVFAVSDGMGGAKAGEFASRIAVEKITKLLPKGYRSMASGMAPGFDDLFQQIFDDIHRALNYLGANYEECAGMGSTLTLCWFTPGWMYFGHIGDSRLYYLPAEGGLKQLSQDDSHVGWLLRSGRISEREARGHPGKNSLHKALGAGHQFIEAQAGAVGFQKGDLFLLCSDGLIDGLWDRQLLRLLREPDAREAALPAAQRLVEAALERSGRDNITAVVVEMG
jgi:protein phosphatase